MSAPAAPRTPATPPPPPPQTIGLEPPGTYIPGAATLLIWIIILKSALKSLFANKLRSILAMLGIIIGIAAVIAMLAMGAGAQEQVTSRFQAMGTNLLFVRPAQTGTGGVITGTAENLLPEDGLAIAQLPGIAAVSPGV